MHDTSAQGDPVLLALVATAEHEENPPLLRILTGSWLVQGRLAPAAEFRSRTTAAWEHQAYYADPQLTFAQKDAAARAQAAPFVSALATSPPEGPQVLTLINCQMIGSTGVIMHVPELRMPVSSVDAWWSSDFQIEESKKGNGTLIGVGFTF
jgi:hypothetical protein